MANPDTLTLSPAATNLSDQEICREVLLEKYAKGDEASAPDALRQVRLRVAHADEQMKMIGQQAIGKRLRYWLDMPRIEF